MYNDSSMSDLLSLMDDPHKGMSQ